MGELYYIYLRETMPWHDEEAIRGRLWPGLQPAVDLWNRCFEIPFHLFRNELKQIAALNVSRVEGATFTLDLAAIPDGAVVLPCDDDDWFAPDVPRILEAERDRTKVGCYWTRTFMEVPVDLKHAIGLVRDRFFPNRPPKWICTTNNHAFVKSAETAPLYRSHIAASDFVVANPGRIQRIDRRLALQNRSLASTTTLGWRRGGPRELTEPQLLRKFAKYRSLYRSWRPPEGLEWSAPYIGMMRDLMDRLRPRTASPLRGGR
ncbi:MAG TPA: hypothetical protein VHF22_01370 [Planctomycetota bacterium]|nr:hypothetical protein [Planctomycetota bacterium]